MANGWTPESKVRHSQLIQNWQPWNKSTGARTSGGKAVSSRNTFKGRFRESLRSLSSILKDHKQMLK